MTRLRILLLALLAVIAVAVGVWISNSADARREVKTLKTGAVTQANTAAAYDQTMVDKLQQDAAIDRGVAAIHNQRREAKRRDPVYREYLDRPLPADTLRLYRDAAAAIAAERAGADREKSGADPED